MPDSSATPPTPPRPPVDPSKRTVGELFLDVSEKTTTIVREEIELAKAEVSEKVTKLLRGSAVGVAAGVFAFLALILILVGIAFLIDDLFFDSLWPGFLIVAAVLLIIAAIAGWLAYRAIQAGSPPVPVQAIEGAKQTRAVLEGSGAPDAPTPNALAPDASTSEVPRLESIER